MPDRERSPADDPWTCTDAFLGTYRARADTQLVAARDGFASMGAATYVARCERELRAGGVHFPRGGVDRLTPQEEAVARMVARGSPTGRWLRSCSFGEDCAVTPDADLREAGDPGAD